MQINTLNELKVVHLTYVMSFCFPYYGGNRQRPHKLAISIVYNLNVCSSKYFFIKKYIPTYIYLNI